MWLISVSDVFRGEKRCFALREASLCSCRSSDLYNCLRLLVLCCVVLCCDSGKWSSLTNEISRVAYGKYLYSHFNTIDYLLILGCM